MKVKYQKDTDMWDLPPREDHLDMLLWNISRESKLEESLKFMMDSVSALLISNFSGKPLTVDDLEAIIRPLGYVNIKFEKE